MLPTDFDCANVCAKTYWAPQLLTRTLDVSGVFVGIEETPDATIICCRGSTTFLDWIRDFEDGAQMVSDPDLGLVHPGFVEGMRDVMAALGELKYESVITGHSLGAARSWVLAALLEKVHPTNYVDKIVTFGSPLPGGQQLSDEIKTIPKIAYKNRHDPVADVPFDIPIIDPYVKPCGDTRVNIQPSPDDLWGIFADHHFQLYWQALDKGQTPPPNWMPAL